MHSLDDAVRALRGRHRILVFTGAGISTESGIPDFRGPDGVWTKVDPDDFTLRRYLESADIRRRSWGMRRGLMSAEPNDAHHAIADLWGAGLLIGVVTQNIDGLHSHSGLPDEGIVEVHGTVRTTSCMECGHQLPTPEVFRLIEDGDEPLCPECSGILKVDAVFFGEQMPMGEMARAYEMADRADAVLAVGTTLSVFPAAAIPLEVEKRGQPFVILNRGQTDFDELADVIVETAAGEGLRYIADALLAEERSS